MNCCSRKYEYFRNGKKGVLVIRMTDFDELKKMAEECGFSHAGALDVSTIILMDEVRAMCSSNKCKAYGTNWCCPPAIGDLDACREKIGRYTRGLLVQTTGELEDELDGETMIDTQREHMEHFELLRSKLLKRWPEMLSCGAGTCTRCSRCTYPDAPCRFPDNTFASMEAYGMLVTQVCQANGLAYYYGPLTITYTSCFLLE